MIYNGKAGINRNLKILTNDEEIIKSYILEKYHCIYEFGFYYFIAPNKNWFNKTTLDII